MSNKQDFAEAIGEDYAVLNVIDSVDAEGDVIILTDSGIEDAVYGPVRFSSSGTLPAPLEADTDYWLLYDDTETFFVCTSQENAEAETPVVVNITNTGSGTHAVLQVSDETPISDAVEMALIELTQAGNRTQPTASKRERFDASIEDFGPFNSTQDEILDGVFAQLDYAGMKTYPLEQVSVRFWDGMIEVAEAAD